MNTYLENTEIHFEMTVKEDIKWSDTWNEKIVKSRNYAEPSTNLEAVQTAKYIIEDFNSGLKPLEIPRVLINVQRVETKVIDLIEQIFN